MEQQEKSKDNGDTGRQIALDTRMRRGAKSGGKKETGRRGNGNHVQAYTIHGNLSLSHRPRWGTGHKGC